MARKTRKRSESQHSLTSSIRALPGIGTRREELLRDLGIQTIGDLLVYPPRRYIDRASFSSIAQLGPDDIRSVIAKVSRTETRHARGKHIFVAQVEDATGRINCVWFNQPYLRNVLRIGDTYVFSGRLQVNRFGKSLMHPEYEAAGSELLHTGRVVPVYGTRPGLGQKQIRTLVKRVLDRHSGEIVDYLPRSIRRGLDLAGLEDAIVGLHFPRDLPHAEISRKRLAFDEVLLFQTLFALARLERKGALPPEGTGHLEIMRFSSRLPFKLTHAQTDALGDITADIADRYPMRRLLQGDVACGKTVVASLAAAVVCNSGAQVALMCPTEILAEQHHATLSAYLAQFGFEVGLLSGSMDAERREQTIAGLLSGTTNMVVGTHALLGERIRFRDLRLIVVDEEQRFGVVQRARLVKKAPHANLLVISATPIPRTLALTAYGDLDVTTIREMPPGRGRHTSRAVGGRARDEVLKEVASRIDGGEHGFYVCPAVDEAEGALVDVGTVKRELTSLLKTGKRVEILTGRTRRDVRTRIIDDFRSGTVGFIVATTVVEVGMDIPSATILVVDQAERFGLSQLHQMRGRVARTEAESFSYFIISESASEKACQRVGVLEATFDGFEVAERDLMFRGPGDVVGTRQHGVPDMRFARLPDDMDLILAARDEAFKRVLGGDASPEWQSWVDAVARLTEGEIAVV